MTTLPPELWLIILEMVVEGNIVGLWQCDRATFPYIRKALRDGKDLYRLHDLHRRLRLVCRSFNAMVGYKPMLRFSASSSFPLPNTIRGLVLDFAVIPATHFQRLLEEMSTCRQLVCLDVTCNISPSSNWPSLSAFFRASEERAFHDVQRLVLRLSNNLRWQDHQSLWKPLNRAFPLLVTLVITLEHPGGNGQLPTGLFDEDVTFENLEILYLGGAIPYWGLTLPRLKHASIVICSQPVGENLSRSPYLESLLIRNYWMPVNLDVRPYSHLRFLGMDEVHLPKSSVVLRDADHPVEHFWLFAANTPREPGPYWPFDWIVESLPGISRITIDFLLVDVEAVRQRTKEFRRMKLVFIGLSMMPPTDDNRILNIEPVASVAVEDGIWSKVRRMMRR